MKIAVRMDDVTPHMDRKKFEAFRTLLDEYGICPLIGVVPDNRDENLNREDSIRLPDGEREKSEEDFWEEIRGLQRRGWIVAMHGYRHVYTEKKGGMFPLNYFSEFAGIGFDEQKRMLAEASKRLSDHGITTDIFMAPAHSYDKNTLRALRELGFTKITDGFGRGPYRYAGMLFYPIAFRLDGSLKRKNGVTTMVVHTNTMSEKDLERYRGLFESGRMISYGEYLTVPAAGRGVFGRMLEYALAAVKHLLVKFL